MERERENSDWSCGDSDEHRAEDQVFISSLLASTSAGSYLKTKRQKLRSSGRVQGGIYTTLRLAATLLTKYCTVYVSIPKDSKTFCCM